MSSVTTCPNCQTQFAVTPEQLSKYNGKVRCGHCLHVFDATKHLVGAVSASTLPPKKPSKSKLNAIKEAATNEKTLAKDQNAKNDFKPEIIIKEAEEIIEKTKGTEFEADEDEDFAITDTIDYSAVGIPFGAQEEAKPQTIQTPSAVAHTIPKKRKVKKSSSGLMWLLIVLFIFAAILQAIYFLRDEIAIYYPSTKPLLQLACEPIGCSINLPKKIDYIVIDDSGMQEDTERKGMIRLNSTLINQAGFTQAFPNLELTLTDTENKPKLRRTFTPEEYLTNPADAANGMPAGAEIKVNLAISTKGEAVSGYRIFVTY